MNTQNKIELLKQLSDKGLLKLNKCLSDIETFNNDYEVMFLGNLNDIISNNSLNKAELKAVIKYLKENEVFLFNKGDIQFLNKQLALRGVK